MKSTMPAAEVRVRILAARTAVSSSRHGFAPARSE